MGLLGWNQQIKTIDRLLVWCVIEVFLGDVAV